MKKPNSEVILLDGDLDSSRLRCFGIEFEAAEERSPLGGGDIVIIIKSLGGLAERSLEIARIIRESHVHTRAVIYLAGSAAAYIALSCTEREIKPTGKIIIHLPTVELASSDMATSHLSESKMAEHRFLLKEITEILNRFPKISQDRLFARNQIEFDANQAVAAGLTSAIC